MAKKKIIARIWLKVAKTKLSEILEIASYSNTENPITEIRKSRPAVQGCFGLVNPATITKTKIANIETTNGTGTRSITKGYASSITAPLNTKRILTVSP